jgi:hypothetical protein
MTRVSFKIFVFLTTLGGVPSLVENVSPTAIGRKKFFAKNYHWSKIFRDLGELTAGGNATKSANLPFDEFPAECCHLSIERYVYCIMQCTDTFIVSKISSRLS